MKTYKSFKTKLKEKVDIMWDNLQSWYWDTIPYEYRPGELWYKFKCWVWNRYSTVKPRTLGHTWVDRDDLLPHVMFEILGQYLEKEARNVDWDWNDNSRAALTEMNYLWDWWNNTYLKFENEDRFEGVESPEIEFTPVPGKPYSTMDFKHSSEHAKEIWNKKCEEDCMMEELMEEELTNHMIRLIKVRPYMWS